MQRLVLVVEAAPRRVEEHNEAVRRRLQLLRERRDVSEAIRLDALDVTSAKQRDVTPQHAAARRVVFDGHDAREALADKYVTEVAAVAAVMDVTAVTDGASWRTRAHCLRQLL